MRLRLPSILLALLFVLPLAAQEPPAVIVDTDMLTDCDDAGALALLHVLADRGEARILGMVLNGQDNHGRHGAVVSAINTYFHRPELPIGVCKRPAGTSPRKASSYSPQIFAEFPHDGLLDAQRPDALVVYRRLLAAAPDHSVTIASIGFLTNLDTLLASPGDDLDARPGLALVRAKVALLSLMGGRYPAGTEYNFSFGGTAAAAQRVLASWPDDVAPVMFSGFELGSTLITGKTYQSAPASPMRRCYELAYDSLRKGRPSWDQVSTLFAVRGATHAQRIYWTVVTGGSNQLDAQGANAWVAMPVRGHGYLVTALDTGAMATVIEELMTTPPQAAGQR